MSLTGMNVERVDTRVVQWIYSLDPSQTAVKEHKVLVGQLLDVFIDVSPPKAVETTDGYKSGSQSGPTN